MKEPSQFVFLFFPIFLLFPNCFPELLPTFPSFSPIFGKIFRCQGALCPTLTISGYATISCPTRQTSHTFHLSLIVKSHDFKIREIQCDERKDLHWSIHCVVIIWWVSCEGHPFFCVSYLRNTDYQQFSEHTTSNSTRRDLTLSILARSLV